MSIAPADCGRLARQALPWCGLFCLSLAGAQLVGVAAASLPTPVNAPLVIKTKDRHTGGDVASSAGSQSVLVMITVQDATTGNEAHMVCRTTRELTSSDALLLGSEAAPDVLPALCQSTWLPAPALYNRDSVRSNDVSVLDPYLSF